MNSEIRILLVDDQLLIREGIRIILEMEDDFKVVGEAKDGFDALALYEKVQPDVILMDIRMPKMDGVEATKELIKLNPDARIIILTTFDDDTSIFEAIRSGALGYLLKDVSGAELSEAIRKVHQGGALIEPSIARKVLAEFTRISVPLESPQIDLLESLSDREIEILKMVADGSSNKEIASKLFLAEGTVKNYISSILAKLNATDRTEAAVKAHQMGII